MDAAGKQIALQRIRTLFHLARKTAYEDFARLCSNASSTDLP